MKKNIKYNIFGFIISGIIFGSIGVGAATLYYANQISYTPTDTTWNVGNVESALDDLYNTTSIIRQGDATVDDILSGKTAIVNGKLLTGTLNATSVYYLGSGTSFNVKNYYDDWASLTTDNFYVKPSGSASASGSGGWESGSVGSTQVACSSSITLSYNASTGVLSAYLNVSGRGGANGKYGASASGTAVVKAYLILN